MRVPVHVVAGLDPRARDIASTLAGGGAAGLLPQALDVGEGWAERLKAVFVTLMEQARGGGGEPAGRMTLLASAADAAPAELLAATVEASRVLGACVPGQHEVRLVLFLPHRTEGANEKIRAYLFFAGLEDESGDPGRVRTVMVHEGSTGEVPALHALLRHELFDETVGDALRAVEGPEFGRGRRVKGRRCWYSACGARRLVYPAAGCLAHLVARFGQELFAGGFCREKDLSERALHGIQARLDGCVARTVERVEEAVPRCPPLNVAAAREDGTAGTNEDWIDRFETSVRKAQLVLRAGAGDRALAGIEGWALEDLLDLLGESPPNLAAGRAYVEALLGRRIDVELGDAPSLPSGVVQLELALRRDPLLPEAVRVLEPAVRDVAAALGVPEAIGEGDLLRDPSRIVELLAPLTENLAPGPRAWTRFCLHAVRSTMDRLGHHRCDAARAGTLPQDLADHFRNDWPQGGTPLDELRKRRAELAATLLKERTLWRRLLSFFTGRRRYLGRVRRLEQDLAEVERRIGEASEPFERMRALLLRVTGEVALPLFARALAADAAWGAAAAAAQQFEEFTGGIERRLGAAWESAKNLPAPDDPLSVTVLDGARLDRLFGRIAGGRAMAEFVPEVLAFEYNPNPVLGPEGRKPRYSRCRDLRDHFHLGSGPLAERIEDFARRLFAPVEAMDVLEVLELAGDEAARDALAGAAKTARESLDFSPALLAFAAAEVPVTTAYVVRVAEGQASRLARQYGDLFGHEPRFVASDDPNVIDVTGLVIGFPAFALHVLEECRALAAAAGACGEGELWPE